MNNKLKRTTLVVLAATGILAMAGMAGLHFAAKALKSGLRYRPVLF